MRLKDVEERVEAIWDARYDDEVAHSLEDDLYLSILKCVAESDHVHFEIASMAREALKTQDMGFERWCA